MNDFSYGSLGLILDDFFQLNIFEDISNLKIKIGKNKLNISLNLFYFNNFFNKINNFFGKYYNNPYNIDINFTNDILLEVNITTDIEFKPEYDDLDYKAITILLQRMVITDKKSEYYLKFKEFYEYYQTIKMT